jgi:hypothetical protein
VLAAAVLLAWTASAQEQNYQAQKLAVGRCADAGALNGARCVDRGLLADPNDVLSFQRIGFCSATTTQVCSADTDCPGAETCDLSNPIVGSAECDDCVNDLQCDEQAEAFYFVEHGGEDWIVDGGVPAQGADSFRLATAWDTVFNAGGPTIIPPGASQDPPGTCTGDPASDCGTPVALQVGFARGNTTCVVGAGPPCLLCPAGDPVNSDNPVCGANTDPGLVAFYSPGVVATEADQPILSDQIEVDFYRVCDFSDVEGEVCNQTIKDFDAQSDDRTIECGGRLQNYKCYSAKPKPGTGGFDSKEVLLTDQFGSMFATVATPFELCNPVRKEGLETDSDASLNGPGEPHLMCYKLVADTIGPDVLIRATDQFGTLPHRVGNSVVLCQPALKSCFDRAVEQGATEGEAESLCEGAFGALDAELAHFNCYNSFEQEEAPFGQCSDTVQVCSVDEDCPGFETGETCVELPAGVPYVKPDVLELTDQFGTTLSDIKETSLHCNPLTAKQVDGGTPEIFVPPVFPGAVCSGSGTACSSDADCNTPETCVPLFAVPEGIDIAQEEVHYRCYDIDDDGPPEAFEDDPRNRYVLVEDQFGAAEIQVGTGTRLCEPAVKELLEQVKPPNNRCGLLGIEALIVLAPLAARRRRRGGGR